MHRIDSATKAPDLFGVGKDGWKDGNKAAGIVATDLTAAFFNDLQENVCGVIEGAGIALSKGDGTQLRQAIAKMIQSGQRAVVIGGVTFAPAVTLTGKAVYWDAANNRFDLALADGSVKQNCVGFADVPNGNVYAFGDAVLFAGLTPGARYYLDAATPGLITSVAPANAVFVGIARTATEVFVDIDALGGATSKQIQSVTASVAANALTLGLVATTLDFRNTALTNGTPNAGVAVGALSLVVPSGATLGTVSGQSARLAYIVAYNGGAPVLCVANLAGGVNLDETTLISPTTISAGATSAGVIYSASAVGAGSPFRVVGMCDVSEVTAGTWATAPALVQGVGGQAIAALQSLGYGQTWQSFTVGTQRVNGTTYYNNTGRPRLVSVWGGSTTSLSTATVNGVQVWGFTAATGTCTSGTTFVVPPGGSYSATFSSNVSGWSELQ